VGLGFVLTNTKNKTIDRVEKNIFGKFRFLRLKYANGTLDAIVKEVAIQEKIIKFRFDLMNV